MTIRSEGISRYWHTLRYLRPRQFWGRVASKLQTSGSGIVSQAESPPLRPTAGAWQAPARREPCLLSPVRCRFLNSIRDVEGPLDWDRPQWPLLWRYNLHYFDDLNARDSRLRWHWHEQLLTRWIAENRRTDGTAFAPYPTSLRIVNWIKWFFERKEAGVVPSQAMLDSLAAQAGCLSRRIEYHLLGNHLMSNAKALIFVGAFFEGPQALRWLATGCEIAQAELQEQILKDGGHFERSPMYHALALEDLLDICNLTDTYGPKAPPQLLSLRDAARTRIAPMLRWLSLMCHPDGGLSLFNDSADGIAPSLVELNAYARRLGFGITDSFPDGVLVLADSGYVRCQRDDVLAILDCARIGPDYLPGHAHADTLSFEYSFDGQRCLVNSGTSIYEAGERRSFERSTAAHNAVSVDGQDSSEVWASFRVARRAYPLALEVNDSGAAWTVVCAHDGFQRLPGRVVHRRRWKLSAGNQLSVRDDLSGGFSSAMARLHVHPSWRVDEIQPDVHSGVSLTSAAGSVRRAVSVRVMNGPRPEILPCQWAPEFGRLLPSKVLCAPVPREGCETIVEGMSRLP